MWLGAATNDNCDLLLAWHVTSGLMIVLIAVGVMNVAVMAVLAVVIFAEKLWRHGKPFGQVVGVLLVATGVLAIWFPWLLPGLHVSSMPTM